MSSSTDTLHLNETKLFNVLRSSLPKDAKETKNILDIRDNVIFVWFSEKSCILTLDATDLRSKNVITSGSSISNEAKDSYQTLQPTCPPIFEVTGIVINETCSQLVLWGSLGIVLVELPQKWGKESKFQGGKDIVSCISHNLDGLSSQMSSEIRKVRWHPGSTNDSHLVVLTSDNVFQLFECEIGSSPQLIRTWKVGPSPSLSASNIPSFAALGDVAVDFDFATPTVSGNHVTEIDTNKVTWDQIEWPILVLRGNGEVLIVHGNVILENRSKPVVYGSLSMYPPAADNYSADSCSIMCLQTVPPIIVIATCSGKIYHSVLLKEDFDDDDKKTWSHYGSTYSLHTPEDALFVFEIVELELGLLYKEDDKKYTCPVHLHKDRSSLARYFCSHNAGIHVVNLPIVSQLRKFVNSSEEKSDLCMPRLENHSHSQYLVCTRTKHITSKDVIPVLGFGLLQEPCVVVTLLNTGKVVDLPVVDLDFYSNEPTDLLSGPIKQSTQEPFDVHIRKLLKHEFSQPITMLGQFGSNLSAKQSLEVMYYATTTFRTNHFVVLDRAREEINKKVRTLITLKQQQLKELDDITEERKRLLKNHERLSSWLEDLKKQQEVLAERAQEALRLTALKEPPMTMAERRQAEIVIDMRDQMKELDVKLKQLQKKSEKVLAHSGKNTEKKEFFLNKVQEDTVKKQLSEQSKIIGDMMTKAKNLDIELGE